MFTLIIFFSKIITDVTIYLFFYIPRKVQMLNIKKNAYLLKLGYIWPIRNINFLDKN
jgi:hypothetical protein